MKFCRILLFAFLIFQPFISLAQKDTLLFKNKSVIIGKILDVRLGVIRFDPDDANDITVQLRKLESLHAVSRDFRIETIDHSVLIGTLRHSPQSGYVNVILGTDTTALLLNDISNMFPVERNFRKRIDGYAGAGFNYTKSSDLGRLNLDGSATYQTRTSETSILYNSITTIEEGETSRDNENAGLRFNYRLDSRWYGGAMFTYQRNIELGIASRFQEGLGIGNKLISGKYVQLMGFAGPVINQEKSMEGEYSGNLTEIIGGIRFNVFRFEKPELDIEVIQNGYIGLTQERYRYDGNIAIRWEIIEDLDLNLSFYSNFDTRSPDTKEFEYDYGTVIGFSYEF